MDPIISARLDSSKNNPYYDAELYQKIGNVARQYVDAGMSALNYSVADFDAASDLVDMSMPVVDVANYEKMDRNHALNFRHPATFEQMWTLTTFIAEILFGGETARTVEPQDPNHDEAADSVNGLLAWNDARLDLFLQGFLWVWNSVVYNRGVWFESADQEVQTFKEEVEEDDILAEKVQATNAKGEPRFRKGEPVMAFPKKKRFKTKRNYSGFYNKLDLVSPYDFVCDPAIPMTRFQEGRFAGHRVMIPWIELDRRSKLDPSEDAYVLPAVVKKIKTQKGNVTTPAALGGQLPQNTSRAYYDRQIRGATMTGIGGIGSGLIAGSDAVNKDDGGTCECFSMTIRAKPKTLGLYPDDEENELITVLITNTADVLSVNVRPNQHDEFPYCVGEAKPNTNRQYSPGWALACKPCQDRMDDLNRTHSQAQKRMGNILLVDDVKCDVSNLLSPDKNGLLILRKPPGQGQPVDDCVAQIKLVDVTANYIEEMQMWGGEMEKLTGAHSQIQGQTEDPSQTATQFEGVQQMATGKISALARILAAPLRRQTSRFVENLKQFMPDSMMIRILGKGSEFDPDNPQDKFKIVKKADIQHDYDVVPHDCAMPGADARTVAASSRALEVFASNDKLAPAFDITIPGAIDPFRSLRFILKKSGMPTEKLSVTRLQAQQNLKAMQMAQGIAPQPGQEPQQAMQAPVPVDATGMPSASKLPVTPTAEPPPPGANLP